MQEYVLEYIHNSGFSWKKGSVRYKRNSSRCKNMFLNTFTIQDFPEKKGQSFTKETHRDARICSWIHSQFRIFLKKRVSPLQKKLIEMQEYVLEYIHNTVAGSEFSWRGANSQNGCATLSFCRKLNENDRIWNPLLFSNVMQTNVKLLLLFHISQGIKLRTTLYE